MIHVTLNEIIQDAKEDSYKALKKDTDLLTALKEDTENFSEEDKKVILDYIKNCYMSPATAIKTFLHEKICDSGRLEVMNSMFPDIMKEI